MDSSLARILYGTFDFIPSMTGRSLRSQQLLDALDGFERHCICIQDEGQLLVEALNGIHFRRILTEGLTLNERIEVYAQTLCSEINRLNPKLVLAADPFSIRVLYPLRDKAGFKLVYEVTGLPSFELEAWQPELPDVLCSGHPPILKQALRQQERLCVQNVDAILVGSTTTASLLCDWGVQPELITVLPTSADMEASVPVRVRSPGAPLELLFAGTFSPWQGLFTLLKGVALAAAQMPIHLTLMGIPRPHTFMEPLRQCIEAHMLDSIVTLVEPLSGKALAKRLGDFDVGLLPLDACSRNLEQGAPLAKAAFYLASGLPVVASDIPMARELLDERCALFFEPGNPVHLAEQLVTLARTRELQTSLGVAGWRHAEGALSIHRTRNVLSELFENLIGELPENPTSSAVMTFDIELANTWLMESESIGSDAFLEELDPEELEPDELDAAEDVEENDEHTHIEAWVERASLPAEKFTAEDKESFAEPGAALSSLEGEAEDGGEAVLDDADDLLDEAIEAEELDPFGEHPLAKSVVDMENTLSDESHEATQPFTDIDELLEEAIETQTVSTNRCAGQNIETVPSALLAQEIHDCLSGKRSVSPASGVTPADEWLGHALFGYAPFEVSISDKGQHGSVEFSPVPRNQR